MTKIEHGANLFELSRKYHIPIDDIRDFSSNINPFGASDKAISSLRDNLNKVSIYPDPAYRDLKQSISAYANVPMEHILLGTGATSLISGFIEEIAPKNAIIQMPAYSEYEKELLKIGTAIHPYYLRAENTFVPSLMEIVDLAVEKKAELIVLCNPNNPTGSILTREDIQYILENTQAYIMVDETYMEFTDMYSYTCADLTATQDRIFVIRGTSKFFSTPGIRLGYALTSSRRIINAFEAYNKLWGINIFADIMGTAMFQDLPYQEKTYQLIKSERDYLIQELSKVSHLKVYPSYGNFILSEIHSKQFTAFDLYDFLLQQGLIIRNCSSFDGLTEYFFRVCTLTHEDNQLLIQKILEFTH